MDMQQGKAALEKYFGYDTFRPMQAKIIEHIYAQKDALVLMPTGGGKSICYQIPAITLPGTCIVVSPLISLMKDQVESLRANGIQAAFLNSSLSTEEQQQVEDDLFCDRLDLLYVSPEKLVSEAFFPFLQKVKTNLFAIDEAHCISSWGHDFRPEYTKLQFLKQQFPDTPVIALTATADKLTRKDIARQLRIPEAKSFVASFDRPNLSLQVRPGQKRFEQIAQFLQQRPNQSGIIYCLSRKSTERLSAKLNNIGISAGFYHAGMPDNERSQMQEDFIRDTIPVICATVAFGMGIDKSNVRWVIHYNLPKNIEGYYQEIGRAGRDGLQADTMLFYSYNDVMTMQEILERNQSDQTELQIAKLHRMQQFATAPVCRRKILLNYFGENRRKNCGNCDICNNPPKQIDGTIIAQKALSAVARLKGQVGMQMLIDILRGSGRKEIIQKGYDQIKTYGAGRHYSAYEWRHYLEQLLNQGYIEIALHDKNKVKLTPASKTVLFESEKVQLVQPQTLKERQEAAQQKAKSIRTERQRVRDGLFEHLRELRSKLARKQGVPPYIIFSDATLEEMAAMKPTTETEMRAVSGVGEQKWQNYGQQFIKAIEGYAKVHNINLEADKAKNKKVKVVNQPKLSTYEETWQLYQQGLSIEQMAAQRSLTTRTIESHLAHLYKQGKGIRLQKYVSKSEIQQVVQLLPSLEKPYRLKEIHSHLNGELDYPKIKFALAYIARKEGNLSV